MKEKTPTHENTPSIIEKTPEDSKEHFKLPPQRTREVKSIEKESVSHPTRRGAKDKKIKEESRKNLLPPMEHSQKRGESLVPSNKGSLPKSVRKKTPVNRKIPRQHKFPSTQKTVPPTRKGVSKKKTNRIRNKAPPQVMNAKNLDKKILPPPSINQKRKKDTKQFLNKVPPKSIVNKTPDKKKSVPPTIIKSKIPKSKIKFKKPE